MPHTVKMVSETVQRPPSSPHALRRGKGKDALLPNVAASAERISAFLQDRSVITPGSALIKSAQLPPPREPSLAERSRSNYTLVEIHTTTTTGAGQQQRGRRRNNESSPARASSRGTERTGTSTRQVGNARTVTVADVDEAIAQPHLSPHRSPIGLLRSAANSWRRSVHGGDEDDDPRNLSGASGSCSDDHIATSTATFFLSMEDDLMSTSAHSRRRQRSAGTRPTRSPAEERLMAAIRNKIEMANAIVSETFAGPPPRVRTETQRHQELLSKEHAKIILLSGRIANLQSRAEDVMDTMAVVASETHDEQSKPNSASLRTMTVTTPPPPTLRQPAGDHELAAASMTSAGHSPLRRKRTGLDVRSSPSPSLEDTLRATRQLTQQFLKEGIGAAAARCARGRDSGGSGGGGTSGGDGDGSRCAGAEVDKDFNVARLHDLVDRLTANIAVLERSVDGGVPESASAQHRRELLETVSNLKDMYWLIESLDHVLISAAPDAPRHTSSLFLTDTPYLTGDPTRPISGQRGSLGDSRASMSSIGGSASEPRGSATRPPRSSTTMRSAEVRRSRSLALPVMRRTDTASVMNASGTDNGLAIGAPDEDVRRVDSEPSMVPFSLHGSSTISALLPAGASRLQLLDFMFDAIAEEQAAALRVEQARHARRPITAPLAVPFYELQRAALTHAADQGDTEGDEEKADEQRTQGEGDDDDDEEEDAGNDVSSAQRNGASSGQRTSRGITSATGRTSSGGSRDSVREPFTAMPPSPHGQRACQGRAHSLRPEFFDGLRRMYKEYDYPQLLDAAHRASLSRISRKSQEAYVLEMAAKLENFHHRASQAAPVELDELEGWSAGRPTTRGGRSSFDGTSSLSRGSQGRATASLYGPGSRATSAHERRGEAEAGAAPGWSRPPTASATAPFVCAQETVLLLERLQDGIVFSVVGEMSADSVARYEQASPDERRRRSSSGLVFDRYTVRVRNEVVAGHATPPCDTLATVQVLRERLRNLTVQAAEGVASRMSLGHASFQGVVGPGMTRVLCTLHPVVAGRASGFEHAFVFAQEPDAGRASTPASGQRGFDSFNSLQPVVRGEGDDDALSISSGGGSGKEEGGHGAVAGRPLSRASTAASRGSGRGVAGRGKRKAGGGVVLLPRGVATRRLGQKRHSSVARPAHRDSDDATADKKEHSNVDEASAAAATAVPATHKVTTTTTTKKASAAPRGSGDARTKPPLATHAATDVTGGSGDGGGGTPAAGAAAALSADAVISAAAVQSEEGGTRTMRGMSFVSAIERPTSREAETGRESREASHSPATKDGLPHDTRLSAAPPPLFTGEPRSADAWGATQKTTQEEAMEKNYIALSAMQVGAMAGDAAAVGAGVAEGGTVPMDSHLSSHAADEDTTLAATDETGEGTRRRSMAPAMAKTIAFTEPDAVADSTSRSATATRAASRAGDAFASAVPCASSPRSPEHRPSTSMHEERRPRSGLSAERADLGTADKTATVGATATTTPVTLPPLRTPSPAGAASASPRIYRGGSLPPPTIVVSSAQSRPLRSKEDVEDYAAVGVIHWDVTDDERESGVRPPTAVTESRGPPAAVATLSRSDNAGMAGRTPSPSGAGRGGTAASRATAASRRSTMGSPGVVYDVAEEGLSSGLLPVRMQLPEIAIHRSGDTGNLNVLLPVGVDFVQDIVRHPHAPQQRRASEAETRHGASRRSMTERKRSVFRQSPSLSLSTGTGVQQQRSSLQTQSHGGSIDEAILADPSARRAHSLLRAVTRGGVNSRSGASVGSSAVGRLSQGRPGAGSLAETGGSSAPSEMAVLEQEARELFMQDPLRYDDVIDELLQFAVLRVNGQPATPPQSAAASSIPLRGSTQSDAVAVAATTLDLAETPTASTTQSAAVMPGANAIVLATPSLTLPGAMARHRSSQATQRESTVSFATLHRLSIDAPGHASLVSLDSELAAEKRASREERTGDATPHVPPPPQRRQSSTTLQKMEELAKMAEGHVSEEGKTEIERILYEQMKAKLILRIMITQMRALWARKQREQDEKRHDALTQALQQAMQSSWTVERSRIMNLHKLITILDRRVQRVHGWLPFYSDDNVLVDPDSEYCPRYLHLLPQRRLVHAMYLAKRRRLLPLRLLRTELVENWNKHLLFGYRKQVVPPAELVVEGKGRKPCGGCGCRRTTGERMRYRRRLLQAAPFQAPSKMYSPCLRWEADLPFARH